MDKITNTSDCETSNTMDTFTLNRETLSRVRGLMMGGLPANCAFDMQTFVKMPSDSDLGVLGYPLIDPTKWGECGAVCCAAGWSAAYVEPMRVKESPTDYMFRLCIRDWDRDRMYGPNAFGPYSRRCWAISRWLFAATWSVTKWGKMADVAIRIEGLLRIADERIGFAADSLAEMQDRTIFGKQDWGLRRLRGFEALG